MSFASRPRETRKRRKADVVKGGLGWVSFEGNHLSKCSLFLSNLSDPPPLKPLSSFRQIENKTKRKQRRKRKKNAPSESTTFLTNELSISSPSRCFSTNPRRAPTSFLDFFWMGMKKQSRH